VSLRLGTPRTLPLRLPPLPGEPLDSWLEAYCRRLDVTTGLLLAALGLRTHLPSLPDHTIYLHPAEARRVAHLTGVEVARLHAMTLRVYDGHALRLDQRRRAVARSAWWARARGSRFCPSCLSERDGRWLLRWRLSWVFACTDHEILLHDTCPACERIPRRSVTATGSLHPPATCPGASGRPCGVELRTIGPLRLAGDDPLLATQRWINTLLSAAEAGTTAQLPTTPATVFGDLRAVGGWLLRQSVEGDFHRFGPYVQHAWLAYRTRLASRRTRPGMAPPTAAPLIGATATRAAALINGDDEQAIGQLRALLRRSSHQRQVRPPRPSGLAYEHWKQLSAPLHSRFLRAVDPDLAATDRIRYWSCTPQARLPLPDADPAPTRTRHVPQLLWPGWTIRLLPAGFRADHFRTTMSACLLLPGHPLPPPRQLTANLPTQRPLRIAATLRSLADQGHQPVFAAICHLARYLDEHGSPIDYQRRRVTVAPATITTGDWQELCYQLGAHPGQARRLLDAQRYLYQLLTAADLGDRSHTLAFRTGADRAAYMAFTESLTSSLRDGLADHAIRRLGQLGIDEPLTWEPPAACCPDLKLPGRDPDDIDLHTVHRLVVAGRRPPSVAASRLGTTIDHIRLALERIPRTPHRWGANAAPMAWQRRQHAQQLLTRDFFEREYTTGGKRLAQIAAETGLPKKLVAHHARQTGIALIAPGHNATPIDPDWLRHQYLNRKRSFPDIAAELGVHPMTVNRAAHRHGIPIRPAGVTSHSQMVRTLGDHIPKDIRRAVEGSLWGWQRLYRFQQAMTFPTIEAAADHLGAHQSALVRQLQRLERDIGAQLYQRATHTQPLRPTRRGAALLNALARPNMRTLLVSRQGASGQTGQSQPSPTNQAPAVPDSAKLPTRALESATSTVADLTN